MKNILSILMVFAMITAASAATTCNLPGECAADDWAGATCSGAYGGFDGVGCEGVAMVVAPGVCDGTDDEASVMVDGKELTIEVTSAPEGWDYCDGYGHLAINWISKDGNEIQVRYLDGFDDDAFTIEYDGEEVCDVVMQADGLETWKTATCYITDGEVSVPEFASMGVALVILLTAPGFAYVLAKKRQ